MSVYYQALFSNFTQSDGFPSLFLAPNNKYQGGHRKSYYKAAALIAALGETMESNGKLHGRMVLIEHYKKMHSRKRAFKTEFEMLNEK